MYIYLRDIHKLLNKNLQQKMMRNTLCFQFVSDNIGSTVVYTIGMTAGLTSHGILDNLIYSEMIPVILHLGDNI